MAQRLQVLVLCDVCEDGKSGSQTVTFAADGNQFEVDLCEKHAADFRESFSRYAGVGRRLTASRARPGVPGQNRHISGSSSSRRRARKIREWAHANGLELSPRGRIPGDVVARYEAESAQA